MAAATALPAPRVQITETAERIVVDTGAARFQLQPGAGFPFAAVTVGGEARRSTRSSSAFVVTDASGQIVAGAHHEGRGRGSRRAAVERPARRVRRPASPAAAAAHRPASTSSPGRRRRGSRSRSAIRGGRATAAASGSWAITVVCICATRRCTSRCRGRHRGRLRAGARR